MEWKGVMAMNGKEWKGKGKNLIKNEKNWKRGKVRIGLDGNWNEWMSKEWKWIESKRRDSNGKEKMERKEKEWIWIQMVGKEWEG